MSTGQIIRVVLEVLVFAAWAYMTYRMVTTAQQRAAAKGDTLTAQIRAWFTSPDDKQDRNTFVWLSLVLAAMIATNVLLPQ
ncbi:hypothetical protein KUL25_14350 [Rhodobacteraceae bacterium N5(2021)]|uniref:Uncharacterized protein n=1 Tax=Gymnodinialimonas phycosphaerae TaxID=2841589 RepID=A0A975TS41_9RHOB|nr:hypothetical protein [Gymnodinialimonas phycosphaerae]MBY4893936.1 hypothetical protein [Gymnodinialimonas phycosphaerae]